jgi:hyperosmotically inducible protein
MAGTHLLPAPTDREPALGQAVGRELAGVGEPVSNELQLVAGVNMKHLVLASMIAAGVVCGPVVLADESGTAPDSSHHYVKDSVITTKVKSILAAQRLSTLTRITVDTDENGVVWLSGRAPTQNAVDLATMIALNTDGVTSVHNEIAVQP